MELGKLIKNALVLAQNPLLRNDILGTIRKLNLHVIKSTGLAASAFEEICEDGVVCNVIFIDIKLSDMNAEAFLKALREKPKFNATHVIAMYGDTEIASVADLLNFGLSGTLRKPFSTDQLKDHLLQRMTRFSMFQSNLKALGYDSAANFFEKIKHFDTALQYYIEVRTLVDSAQINFDVGRIEMQLGKKEDALASFKKAVELDPKFKKLTDKFVEVTAAVKGATNTAGSRKIPKEVLKLFNIPADKFASNFFGSGLLQSICIAGGSHQERISIKSVLTSLKSKDVKLCNTGAEALRNIQAQHYDLILVNIHLADMNGLQFVDVLRKKINSPNTLIVLMLEQDLVDNLVKAFEIGLDGFVLKPITFEQICVNLHSVMVQQHMTLLAGRARLLTKAAYFLAQLTYLKAAHTFATRACEVEPDDGVGFFYLALINQLLDNRDAARENYAKASAKNPDLTPLCEQTFALRAKEIDDREKVKREEELKKKKENEKDLKELLSGEDAQGGSNLQVAKNSVTLDEVLTGDSRSIEAEDKVVVNEGLSISAPVTRFVEEIPISKSETAKKENLDYEIKANKAQVSNQPDYSVSTEEEPLPLDTTLALTSPVGTYTPLEQSPPPKIAMPSPEPRFDIAIEPQGTSELQFISSPLGMQARVEPLAPSPIVEAEPPMQVTLPPDALLRVDSPELVSAQVRDEQPALEAHDVGILETINAQSSPEAPIVMASEQMISQESLKFIDPTLTTAQIPQDMRENAKYGVSAANYPLKRGFEQVATGAGVEVNVDGKYSVKVVASEIAGWMPTEKLESISPIQIAEAPPTVSTQPMTDELQEHVAAAGALITQARLFNTRLLAQVEQADSLTAKNYLETVGKVLTTEDVNARLLASNITLPENILKLAKKAEKNNDLYERVGLDLIQGGHLDQFFTAAENQMSYALGQPEDVREQEVYQMRPLLQAIQEFKKPALKLHEQFSAGNNKFEDTLPYYLGLYDKSPPDDFSALYRAMEIDHHSFESFKKIYSNVKHMRDRETLENFLGEVSDRFMHSQRLRDNLAKFLIAADDKDLAREVLVKSLDFPEDKNNIYILRNLALMAYKAKDFKDSIKWCKKILGVAKNDLEAFNLFGASLRKLGKTEKAISIYRKGLKHHTDSFKLRHNLAIALANVGRREEAREELVKANQKVGESSGEL